MESSQSNREGTSKRRLTPELAAAQRKKESLLLARIHLTRQFQATPHPRHRTMLESALADVEKQLAEMGESDRAKGGQ